MTLSQKMKRDTSLTRDINFAIAPSTSRIRSNPKLQILSEDIQELIDLRGEELKHAATQRT